jgi:hypothetical protein
MHPATLFDDLGAEAEKLTAKPSIHSPMVDAFALHAPPQARISWRIAILIWGAGYLGAARGFLAFALQRRSVPLAIFSALCFAAGARICLNAFSRNHRREQNVTTLV